MTNKPDRSGGSGNSYRQPETLRKVENSHFLDQLAPELALQAAWPGENPFIFGKPHETDSEPMRELAAMSYSITAIPTVYKNTRFRSRLEARWACMFDLLQWQWSYEPIDLAGWIPDFILQFARPVYVEVKPFVTHEEFIPLAKRLSLTAPQNDILLLGARLFEAEPPATVSLGWVGAPDVGEGRGWGEAVLYLCPECFEVSVTNSLHGWRCLKNDQHGRGDGQQFSVPPELKEIAERFFSHAGNVVQWKRPA